MKNLPTNKTKRQHLQAGLAAKNENFEPPILADSLEVMEAYSLEKITALQIALNELTIEDHTIEIISLCQEIKKERKTLMQILTKMNSSSRGSC